MISYASTGSNGINNQPTTMTMATVTSFGNIGAPAAVIIDALKIKNPHERDARITFDPVPHTYTIDGDTDPARTYTSVTTWNHSHFEEFNADAVISKMMASKTWATNEKYKGQTREQIKAGWDSNRDQAAAAGTEMHAAIELFYNRAALIELETQKQRNWEEEEEEEADNIVLQIDDASPIDAPDAPGTPGAYPDTPEFRYFLNFARTFSGERGGTGKTLRAYRTEWTVFHEEARISGSIDMVFENMDPETGDPDGTYSIYDWKRCKEITRHSAFNKWAVTPGLEHLPDTNYWHYCLQLNVYKYILQEKYGKTVTDLYLVCLHPDNSNRDYQRIKVADLQSEVADIMRARAESFVATVC